MGGWLAFYELFKKLRPAFLKDEFIHFWWGPHLFWAIGFKIFWFWRIHFYKLQGSIFFSLIKIFSYFSSIHTMEYYSKKYYIIALICLDFKYISQDMPRHPHFQLKVNRDIQNFLKMFLLVLNPWIILPVFHSVYVYNKL